MPEENINPAGGSPQIETVELQLESKMPSRSRVQGLWHVLDLLKQIERRIEKVNSMTVGPKGGLGGQVATQAANAAKLAEIIQNQARATEKLAAAEGKLQKIRTTKFEKTQDTVTEATVKTGPGKTRTETRLNGTLEKVTDTTDYAAAEKEAAKKRAESEKSVAQFDKTVADAAERRQKEQLDLAEREARHREQLRKKQQVVFERVKSEAEQIARFAALQKHIEDLKAQGFKSVGYKQNVDAKTGFRTTTQFFEKIDDGRKKRVGISQTVNAFGGGPPRLIAGSAHSSESPLNDREGANLIGHIARVTAWQAAVGALYGSLGLAKRGLTSLIETGTQTARLSQVFQGVGGSARDLANDVIKLAAENGRSRDEAMESAIQWSRLGLTRVQVNEAVRVSLLAANVAEITAGQATERLSAIMAAYHLHISQLAGVLGQLNSISNTYNVTNKDLLDGLARTAAVARQAGLTFSETIGIIGAAKGFTGQSGANIGNSLKSMIGSLNDPSKQAFLRDKFRIELTTAGGNDVKDMSKTLADLFIAYQKMTDAERRHMLFETFGKNQASRVAAIMDSYIKGQALAIAAQMNLNSAEKENIQIKQALKAQLTGLVTEWERFINIQGNRGPTQALGTLTETLRNVLRLMNTDTGSAASTGILALMSVLGARVALTAMTVKESGGFMINTFRAIRGAVHGVVSIMSNMNRGFLDSVKQRPPAMLRIGAGGRQFAAFDAHPINQFRNAIESLEHKATAYARAAHIAEIRTGKMAIGARVASFGMRALAASLVAVTEVALPLLLIWGGMMIFNDVMGAAARATEKTERKLAGFNDQAEQAAAASRSAAQAMRLIETVQKALPNARKEARSRMLEDVSSVAFFKEDGSPDTERNKTLAAELQTLERQGKISEVIARLEEVKQQKWLASMIFRNRELEANQQSLQLIRAQIAALDEKEKKQGSLKKEDADRRTDLRRQLSEKGEQRTQILINQSQETEQDRQDFLNKDLKHLAFLEREKVLAQAISDIYANMPAFSHTDKLNAELAAEQAKLKHSQSMLAYLKNDPRIAVELENEQAKKEGDNFKEYNRVKAEKSKVDKELGPFSGFAESLRRYRDEENAAIEKTESFTTLTPGREGRRTRLEEFLKTKASGTDGKTYGDLVALLDKRDVLHNAQTEIARAIQKLRTAKSPVTDASYIRNEQAITEMEKQEREQKARLEALEKARAAREQQDKNDVTLRFGKNQISLFGVGEDESERLTNTEEGLKRLIEVRKKLSQTAATAEERQQNALLALQAMTALEETRVNKLEMLVKLETERTNLIKEQAREYARSLLMAGPGDLLRKLAVKSLADKGGVNLGSFLALSKEGRQDYMDLTGGFKRREMEEQIRRLRQSGIPTTLPEQQAEASRFRKDKQPFYGKAAIPGIEEPENPIISASATAAAEVTRFGTAAASVASQLFALAARIQTQINRLSQNNQRSTPSIWNPLDESVVGGRP